MDCHVANSQEQLFITKAETCTIGTNYNNQQLILHHSLHELWKLTTGSFPIYMFRFMNMECNSTIIIDYKSNRWSKNKRQGTAVPVVFNSTPYFVTLCYMHHVTKRSYGQDMWMLFNAFFTLSNFYISESYNINLCCINKFTMKHQQQKSS